MNNLLADIVIFAWRWIIYLCLSQFIIIINLVIFGDSNKSNKLHVIYQMQVLIFTSLKQWLL